MEPDVAISAPLRRRLLVVFAIFLLGAIGMVIALAPTATAATMDSASASCAAQAQPTGPWACVTGAPQLTESISPANGNAGLVTANASPVGWCETQSICHRKVSNYIEETVGNGVYGVGATLIGRFQIDVTTNLNGRQPRYTVSILVTQGPAVSAYIYVHCKQKGGILGIFDADCFDSAPQTTGYTTNWTSKLIYGNKLVNNGTYYGTADGSFRVAGWTQWFTIDTLTTSNYTCANRRTGPCRF